MSQSATIESIPDETLIEAMGIECPQTNLWSDDPPLESDFHRDQIDLLIRILREWWRDRNDVYISGNLTIYYNQDQLKTRDFRGPDFLSFWVQKRKIARAGWSGAKMDCIPM